ncbi:SCO2322 family protein [Nonomuraea helvata]|uniref:SCO2322 family protein n=1 Tax=Nonomuraea helvata TaxID=37484 RepID=A0ABV5RYQ9_9ACTN
MLRAYRVAAGAVLGAAALFSFPCSALADPGAARAWGVWQSDGTAWLAATAAYSPPDGSVIGWRFSAVPEGAPDGAAGESPGGDLPSFQAVCGKDTAASGHKRVVVAVDFGDGDADAYPGERPPGQGVLTCVTGAEDATTAQLLASVAKVRVNARGAVVAVSGYPSREEDGTDLTAAAPAARSGLPGTLIAGGAGAVALLTAGAVVAVRRRSRAAHRRPGTFPHP